MKTWKATEAKRHFAEILQESSLSPQLVLLRGAPVGVLVSYESFLKTQSHIGEKSMQAWLQDLASIQTEEGDPLLPQKQDRADPFGEGWE